MPRFQLIPRFALLFLALVSLVLPAFAKDTPLQVITWPETGTPVLRFSFSKFKSLSSSGNLRGYEMDTTAENLSARVIPSAQFKIYLFDKNKMRVGEDVIAVSNMGPGETIKFATTVATSGQPVSLTLQEIATAKKTVSMTVISTPAGATLSVDGAAIGTTPRMIAVGPGHHTLTFSKEGFNTGTFPLEISRDDVSGGTITFDLGASSYDTVELRDGAVLSGDVVSISGMDVEMRVAGALQHINRNQIKRVIFVQRDAPKPDALPNPTTSN